MFALILTFSLLGMYFLFYFIFQILCWCSSNSNYNFEFGTVSGAYWFAFFSFNEAIFITTASTINEVLTMSRLWIVEKMWLSGLAISMLGFQNADILYYDTWIKNVQSSKSWLKRITLYLEINFDYVKF